MNEVRISEIILKNFHNWWSVYDNYLYKVCKGGRNSGKSTQIPIRFVRDIIKYPVNGLVVRKRFNTLRNSCFENLMEATEFLNVDHYFKDYKSPLKIVYKPTGQEILFRGADDAQKIKSIKTRKFPLTKLWCEELAEFKSEDEVKTIFLSVLRGRLPEGLKYSIDLSYNPPKTKSNWCNKLYETKFAPDNTYIHHSTYLNNPFVSDDVLNDAEILKESNYKKYEWIFLGKPVGGGLIPFSNIDFDTEITDEMIARFDNIRQGVDFGWTNPTHFIRCHFDIKKDIVYVLDEIRKTKIHTVELYKIIEKKGYGDFRITADSEAPDKINELKSYGLPVKGAKKGAGSVAYGIEWLDCLNKIVVDPKRTPGIAKEFEDIDFKIDKDGNILNELEGDCHGIDALRYAFENDMKYKSYLK